jgi:hypothetical protein
MREREREREREAEGEGLREIPREWSGEGGVGLSKIQRCQHVIMLMVHSI